MGDGILHTLALGLALLTAAMPARGSAAETARGSAAETARGSAAETARGSAAETARGATAENVTMRRANMLLRGRSHAAAVSMFRSQLEKTPDAPAAHIGLAKALARMGRCGEALEHFGPYVGTTPFGHDAAIAAGQCAATLGLDEDARWYNEIAVQIEPASVRGWTALALLCHRLGDEVERDLALDELLLARDRGDASWYAQAALVLREGDVDAFDRAIAAWTRESGVGISMLRLIAQSWLDMDDAEEALDVLSAVRSVQGAQAVRSLRAEASRRTGYPESALATLEDDDKRSVLEGDDADAVRVRVYVDLGRLDEARALVADPDGIDDADLLASAWYVARHDGDTVAADELARRYHAARTSPLRELEQLVPIPQR